MGVLLGIPLLNPSGITGVMLCMYVCIAYSYSFRVKLFVYVSQYFKHTRDAGEIPNVKRKLSRKYSYRKQLIWDLTYVNVSSKADYRKQSDTFVT